MDFSDNTIWIVWAKGEAFGGNDPVIWRKDACGAWIFRSHHNRLDSEYGWVIDHIRPLSEGGTDDISNLRPMHWQNTVRMSDGSVKCQVTSAGVFNDKVVDRRILEVPRLGHYW